MRRGAAAAVALAGLAAASAAWLNGWPGGGTSRRPRSVLLISVDTLRADRIGSYGYKAAATPVIDALAARGLRFEQAATVAPLTLPAHTSLMTGTFPAFHGVRDNGSFYVDDELTTLAEALQRARLPHRRLRRRVRARSPLGHRAGIRSLLRRLRPVEVRDAGRARRRAAPGQRGRRPRAGLARTRIASSRSLRGCTSTIRTAPYVPPEPYRVAIPGDACRARTTARSRRPTRRSAGCCEHLRDQRTARPHARRRRRRSRRVAGRARRAAARLLRLRRGDAHPADRRRPGRAGARRPRSGAHRRRDADDSGSGRRRACRPPCKASSLLPLGARRDAGPAGLQRDVVPALSLRLERADRGARRPLQVHRRAAPRALRHRRPIPARRRTSSASNPRMADALERALRDMAARTAVSATPQTAARDRTRRRGTAAGARLRGGDGEPRRSLADRPRGDPKDKIGLYNLLKLAATGLGRRPARRRDRQGPPGARRRPRSHRSLHDARQHARQGRPACATRSPRTSGRWRSTPSTRARHGAWRSPTGLGKAGRGARRLRAGAPAEPARRQSRCTSWPTCRRGAATSRPRPRRWRKA